MAKVGAILLRIIIIPLFLVWIALVMVSPILSFFAWILTGSIDTFPNWLILTVPGNYLDLIDKWESK